MHTLLISRKALPDQGWLSWLALPTKCSTSVNFCAFRPCVDYSSGIYFYLFCSKQPEIVAVIGRLSSIGKDQMHIWVVLFFSVCVCQVFSSPTWYSTRYHPNRGESGQQNFFQISHSITHIKTSFLYQLLLKNISGSGSCKWQCKYQKCPKNFQESLLPQKPVIAIKATASLQAEYEPHFIYSNEKVRQSTTYALRGNCTVSSR